MNQKTGDNKPPVKKDLVILVVGPRDDLRSLIAIIGRASTILCDCGRLIGSEDDARPILPPKAPIDFKPILVQKNEKPEVDTSIRSTRGTEKNTWLPKKFTKNSIRRKH